MLGRSLGRNALLSIGSELEELEEGLNMMQRGWDTLEEGLVWRNR